VAIKKKSFTTIAYDKCLIIMHAIQISHLTSRRAYEKQKAFIVWILSTTQTPEIFNIMITISLSFGFTLNSCS